MNMLKPLLALALLGAAMLYTEALATQAPPRVGATRPAPQMPPADPAHPDQRQDAPRQATPHVKPGAKPAAKQAAPRRRAVTQILDGMPPRAAPAPTVYRPQLNPAPVSPLPGPSTHILNGCNGAACTDAQGGSYKGGVGTTLISPQGKMCSNNGITVQCF